MRDALQHIVDHAWTANSRQPGQWINEFVDVAVKALAADLRERKLPPVLDAYKKKPDSQPKHIKDDL